MTKLPRAATAVLGAVILTACSDSTGVTPLSLPLIDRVVFQGDADDKNGDIYVMKRDGSDLRRLTGGDAADFCPALSPDGNWIAFLQVALEGGVRPYLGIPSMVLMKADGTDQRVLGKYQSAFTEGCPVWSHDSRLVAFVSPVEARVRNGNNPIVRTYSTEGGLVAQFTSSQLSNLSFSPDNARFVYTEFGQSIGGPINVHIATVKLDGSDGRVIAAGSYGVLGPVDRRFVYTSCGTFCGPSGTNICNSICTAFVDNTYMAYTHSQFATGINPVFAPAGDAIAYSCGSSLCVGGLNLNGGALIQRIGEGVLPVWSSDARSIGFLCGLGPQTDICIADLRDGSVANITNTPRANESALSLSPVSGN